ncbi:MAG: RNA polymerase sigma factor [Myxococcaceae bacterium]|nr:RNA polymerase sigma factor [Myxococcaceae bacterium]
MKEVADLFRQHGPRVYRRALKLLGHPADAEEATQDIFLKAMKGLARFQGKSQLTTWLYEITTHHCLNHLRDLRRRGELHEAHLSPPAEDAAPRAFDLALLRRLLARADEREAQAAIYVFVDGMSHDEAAALLQVSRRTVGNLVERFAAAARAAASESEGGRR